MEQILLLLGITVFLVAVFKHFKLPSIIAYLIIGCALGPFGTGLLQYNEQIKLLADIGVVFLLFTIGLELPLSKFTAMRYNLFLIGGSQVALCTLLLSIIIYYIAYDIIISFVAASAISLSSTAIVIRQLSEQNELFSKHGKLAFTMLIFQDLAVVPLLIILPLLATVKPNNLSTHGLELFYQVGTLLFNGIIVFIIIIALSKSVLKTFFHLIALTRSLELFMFSVLFVALLSAYVTQSFGLSTTFGAFVAGIGLGESEYRHNIDVELRPFRDILLGIFFISIGMLLDLNIVMNNFTNIMIVVLAIVLIKLLVITLLSYLLAQERSLASAIKSGLIMAHAGEFGLAIITLAASYNIISSEVSQIILSAMIVSLFVAVLLTRYADDLINFFDNKIYFNNKNKIKVKLKSKAKINAELNLNLNNNPNLATVPELSHYPGYKDHVIICGFGRVGKILAKFLQFENKPYLAVEFDPEQVKLAVENNYNVYYGDASRSDILVYCSLNRAKLVAICMDDDEAAKRIITEIRLSNHRIPIIVRTRDLKNYQTLLSAGATEIVAETVEASMMLVLHMLLKLGVRVEDVMAYIDNSGLDRNLFLSEIN